MSSTGNSDSRSASPTHTTPYPPALRAAWVVVAAGAAAITWGLVRYWSRDYDSYDRGLILAAAAWAAYRLWPAVAALPPRPRPLLGLFLLVPAAAAFLPPWFVYAQVGPRPILIWWETAAVIAAATGLLLLGHGFAAVTALRFPLLFPILALPLPGRIINPLHSVLQDWTTWLAAGGLSSLGMEVQRDGFLISLPSGGLNVVEACSGVKLLTTLTAVACFVAHLLGFGVVRGAGAVALSIPVIVLMNAVRVLANGVIQERFGKDAILGWKHEALGLVVALIGVALVVGITWLMRPRKEGESGRGGEGEGKTADPASSPSPPLSRSPSLSWLAAGWLAAAAVAAGYLAAVPSLVRTTGAVPDLNQVAGRFGEWRAGPDRPMDPEVVRSLGTDAGLHRVYSRLGYEAHAWVMHWQSQNGVRDYHHPDVCWPNRGYDLLERRVEPVVTPAGRTVPLTYREFARGKERQVVVYWTQEGRRIWTEADERDAISPLFPVKWIGKRLARPDPTDTDDRLAVLVGVQTWDGAKYGRRELLDLTAKLADEVYRVCPWADPGTGPADGP